MDEAGAVAQAMPAFRQGLLPVRLCGMIVLREFQYSGVQRRHLPTGAGSLADEMCDEHAWSTDRDTAPEVLLETEIRERFRLNMNALFQDGMDEFAMGASALGDQSSMQISELALLLMETV